MEHTYITKSVSVPIWGLFNLTTSKLDRASQTMKGFKVSVPIWGLFNLTLAYYTIKRAMKEE